MDWNGNQTLSFASRPDSSLGFLYNCNYDHYQGAEVKNAMVAQAQQHGLMNQMIDRNNFSSKKKRLTSEQLELLENSFQEDIKLDPDRKMILAQELGLQPRQIAVWFQNRRARWKAKELERLYDGLKHELEVVSREKQKLQEEVLALRMMLKKQAIKIQGSTGYTEISGEETVESTSIAAIHNNPSRGTMANNHMAECNYALNAVDDYNPVMPIPTYWSVLPTNYP